jgi:hypothetical protein
MFGECQTAWASSGNGGNSGGGAGGSISLCRSVNSWLFNPNPIQDRNDH